MSVSPAPADNAQQKAAPLENAATIDASQSVEKSDVHMNNNYANNSQYQTSAIMFVKKDIVGAAKSFAERWPNQRSFVVADFGSSDGVNLLALYNDLIPCLKVNGAAVQLYLNDTPKNNWQRLFEAFLVYADKGTFVYGIGRSFYMPCFPPRSVHMGLTSNAMHWINTNPGNVKDEVCAGVLPITHPDFISWNNACIQDTKRFLLNRASEFVPSGQMIMVNMAVARDAEGNLTNVGFAAALGCLNNALKKQVEAGALSREGYDRFTLPLHYLTIQDWRTIFESPEVFACWDVTRLQEHLPPNPFAEMYRASGDVNALAIGFSKAIQAVSEFMFDIVLDYEVEHGLRSREGLAEVRERLVKAVYADVTEEYKQPQLVELLCQNTFVWLSIILTRKSDTANLEGGLAEAVEQAKAAAATAAANGTSESDAKNKDSKKKKNGEPKSTDNEEPTMRKTASSTSARAARAGAQPGCAIL